jgi:hypothetical protein
MATTVTFPPDTVTANVDHYNVYRSLTQSPGGDFSLIGTVAQDTVPEELTFSDSAGTADDYYKISTVDVFGAESLASDAFKALPANLTRLWGQVIGPGSEPAVGIRVFARLSIPQASVQNENSTIPAIVFQETLTDAEGNWFLDLHPNDLLIPAGTQWIVSIQDVEVSQYITLPQGVKVAYDSLVNL